MDSQGRIWALHNGGLFTFDGQSWIHYPRPGTVILHDIFIERDDRIWFTTSSGFASFLDGGWNFYTIDNDGQSDEDPADIAVDARGRVWLPTGWGLTIFDGEQWTTYHMHTSDIAANSISSFAIQAGGPSLPAPIEKELGSISGRIFLNGQTAPDAIVQVCVKSLGMYFTGGSPCDNQPYLKAGKTDEEGRFTLTVPSGHYYLAFRTKDAEKWTRLTSGIAGIASMRIDVLPGKDNRLNDIYLTE